MILYIYKTVYVASLLLGRPTVFILCTIKLLQLHFCLSKGGDTLKWNRLCTVFLIIGALE